jgi:phage terminase large subunit-like protein
MLTTTPKRVKLVQDLVKRRTTAMTTGTTYENLANLAKPFQRAVLEIYENTRIGKQELEGILLDDVEGAMFRQENIDSNRAQWLQVRK